jgi:N utilization substance protein A
MDLKRLPKTEFAAAVAQIAGERNIEVQPILDSIELGLISAYKRDQKEKGIEIPEEQKFTVELSPETGSFAVFKVDEDDKKTDVTPPGFGRIAAQTAKQVIDQKIREAEKDSVIADYQQKLGTLISGVVLKSDPYKVTVGIGRTEGVCPHFEQIKNEELVSGDKKLFLLKEISQDEAGRRDIVLSRADPQFIVKLFAREVPEVENGSVTVEKIARSPGQRTKVAVSSNQPGIDPVGSCIGQKGSRIQSILTQIPADEKVDVVPFSPNINQFIIQALSPAENINIIEINDRFVTVSLPEDQLALAIGSGGENVRLAGQLVGLDIKVVSQQSQKPAKVTKATKVKKTQKSVKTK